MIYFYINRAVIQYFYILLVEYHTFEMCPGIYLRVANYPFFNLLLIKTETGTEYSIKLCNTIAFYVFFMCSPSSVFNCMVDNANSGRTKYSACMSKLCKLSEKYLCQQKTQKAPFFFYLKYLRLENDSKF